MFSGRGFVHTVPHYSTQHWSSKIQQGKAVEVPVAESQCNPPSLQVVHSGPLPENVADPSLNLLMNWLQRSQRLLERGGS